MHVNEYTDEETRNCWFTDKEFKSMKEHARMMAQLLTDTGNSMPDNDMFCSRGLENFTQERIQNKKTGLIAVLEEQALQD